MGTLDIVAETAGNRIVAKAVYASRESVRYGQPALASRSRTRKVFPPMVVRMIAIGERTGALEVAAREDRRVLRRSRSRPR